MYRGRFQQGEEVTLSVLCVDANGAPQAPAAAPAVELWGPAGLAARRALPAMDRYRQPGYFQGRIFLGTAYPPGQWQAIYYYGIGPYLGTVTDNFEVVVGGDPGGSVISAYWFDRPNGKFLVRQLDSGRILKGRNPGV